MTHRLSRALRRLASGLGALVLAGAATVALASPASAAGDAPGSYTHYSWSGVSGLSDVTFRTTVDQDPGYTANIFWSHQFGFTQGNGAYTGMQSNGGQQRTFLFSLWDATEAKLGSAGSYCLDFGGEGVGKSCRMRHDWAQGHTYAFRVAHEGDRWFGVTVTDETTGASLKLGSIRAGSTQIATGGMVDWTEYFEFGDPQLTCYDQPYSRATFGLPKGNGGAVTAAVSSTSPSSSCQSMTRIDVTSGGSVQTNGIGQSVRGSIKGVGGKCADAEGGNTSGAAVILYTCSPGLAQRNQAWVLGGDGAVHMISGLCLDIEGGGTAAGTPVEVYDCHGGANQQWRHQGGTLRNPASGRCLEPVGGASANGTRLQIADCTGAAAQQWQVPVTPA
ncbi:ricin-type beta-trefoil lectin domain protein [Streptomyces sp. FIT100]|uniref:ricin-type beta-trefoil lectin domain protein n=1 Tax=Streptomyces sp. FIT100 TaxID=2837956 RepID=UPI0021C639DC|nr:ricin-type beta-trefoil lectin domain protein [Streptomyces sp. FIT100]UUN30767.1 ricin-type beta-trefoil lectin domain protein [Streptomyces sp. FIT100]